mgnify:FL=1
MKKILFVAAACILAAACKPTETETTTASLEVTPTSLSFAAEDTAPQTITVTAVGVEWTYSLAESGKEWVTIERLSDKELTVAVADNTKAEQRTAAVTFKAKDNNRIKDRSVTIIQQGAENPEVYALTVDPTVLTFEAEGAAGQSVKVTASGEGMTWSAAVEDAAKEWITLSATEGTEGETTLTVAVADNPDTAERSANITITPSEETAGSKVIRISQEPKVLPPSFSLSYREGEVPEEGFTLNYRGYIEGNYTTTNHKIDIEAVNIDWQATVAYDSAVTNWITLHPYKSDSKNHIEFSAAQNEEAAPHACRIIVSTDAEGIGPFEIAVTQEGRPNFLSTLTEDVDFGILTKNYVLVSPNNDRRNFPYTLWDLRFWSDGIVYDGTSSYTGTGDRLCIYLAAEPISINDDNEYYLSDGTYDVVANFGYDTDPAPWTISGGAEYFNPTFPFGSWFHRITEGIYGDRVCITGGKMTVSRQGEIYTLTFDLTSDAGYKVTGSFEGTFDLHAQ